MSGLVKKPLRKINTTKIKSLYLEDYMSMEDIARHLNLTYHDVRGCLHELKCVRSRRQINLNKHKGKINRDYFSIINSQEKAYFLGLLTADGCLQKKGYCVSLSLKEKYMVKKFADLFNSKVCRVKSKKGNNIYYSYLTTVSSEQLYGDLITLGLIPHKSKFLTGSVLNKVPDRYFSHFLRGFIDGDGWIAVCGYNKHQGQVGVVSTKKFIKCFINKVNKHYKIKFNKPLKHKTPYIAVTNLYKYQDVVKFLNIIYKDSNLHLKRKYRIYKKILNLKRHYKPKICKYKGVCKTGSGKFTANLWHEGKTIKSKSFSSEYLAYLEYNKMKRELKGLRK